jgi:hypothetical protein
LLRGSLCASNSAQGKSIAARSFIACSYRAMVGPAKSKAIAQKPKPRVPHEFVVEALAPLDPEVRRMFSGFSVYIGDRIVFMLRDHLKSPRDNGIWLVLSEETNPADRSLRRDFPSLRKIELLGGAIGHWLLIPSDGQDFEREAMRACELVLNRDARIGRVPKSRR